MFLCHYITEHNSDCNSGLSPLVPPSTGYRCFKAVMFLSGLMFGSIIIFLLCHKEHVLDTQLSVEASAGIGLGIGLLCGLVTMLVRSVGLFMTGLLLGLLLALAALLVTHQFYTPTTVWVPLGVLLGTGMLFAVLTLQWQKFFTILSTAVFGAAIMTVCADYFVEMLALVTHVYECLRLTPGPPLCWYSWVILGIWPALSLIGVLVQCKLTGDNFSHTDGKNQISVNFESTAGITNGLMKYCIFRTLQVSNYRLID